MENRSIVSVSGVTLLFSKGVSYTTFPQDTATVAQNSNIELNVACRTMTECPTSTIKHSLNTVQVSPRQQSKWVSKSQRKT